MTREQQRIAIAEWVLDTKLTICETAGSECFIDSKGFHYNDARCPIPNYPLDLNAIHESEKKLGEDNSLQGKVAYNNVLMRVCGSHAASVSATAAQRSEALLRTIGKWVE